MFFFESILGPPGRAFQTTLPGQNELVMWFGMSFKEVPRFSQKYFLFKLFPFCIIFLGLPEQFSIIIE